MNNANKEHLHKMVKQIEKCVDGIEEIQNKESGKYNNLSEDEKNGEKADIRKQLLAASAI
jgi:arsenate reductase-like glutaredoxin family protein